MTSEPSKKNSTILKNIDELTLVCNDTEISVDIKTAQKSKYLCEKGAGNAYDSKWWTTKPPGGYPKLIQLSDPVEIVRKICDFMTDPKNKFPANEVDYLKKYGIDYCASNLLYTAEDLTKCYEINILPRDILYLWINGGVYTINGWTFMLTNNMCYETSISSLLDVTKKELPIYIPNFINTNLYTIPLSSIPTPSSVYGELLDAVNELGEYSKCFCIDCKN